MNLSKYYNETKSAVGENLHWVPNLEYPFVGNTVPNLKDQEFQNLDPTCTFKCKLFDLSNSEDMKEYIYIRDKCANKVYIPIDREKIWHEENQNYKIYLEWVELRYELPGKQQIKQQDAVKELVKDGTTIPYSKLSEFSKSW